MNETLKSLRFKQGLTQTELAKQLGVTYPTISSWELGKSSPNPRHMVALAKALGVTPDQIFLILNTKKLIKS